MSTESSSPVAARKRRKQASKGPSRRRVVRAGRPRLDDASPDTETGFNPALIYYYFGSKDELFRRAVTLAVERAFEQFRLAREGLEHPRDIIYGWLDIHVKEYRTISKLIMIAIDYAKTSKRNVRIDEAIRRFYLDERDVLKAALASGIARGDFRNVDVEETASFISTFLDGVCARAMILKDFDPIVAIGELRSFLNTHLKRKK